MNDLQTKTGQESDETARSITSDETAARTTDKAPAFTTEPAGNLRLNTIRRRSSELAELILFSWLAISAIQAVSEYGSRQSLIERVRAVKADVSEKAALRGPSDSDETFRGYSKLILAMADIQERVASLERSGASVATQTLGAIENDFSDLSGVGSALARIGATSEVASKLNRAVEATPAIPRPSSFEHLDYLWSILALSPISFMRSDVLLAMVAVSCGGIGAVISGIRRRVEFTAIRDVVLGLASGFVVYVSLRGGKYIFLMQEGQIPLNPYGFALAGLLTGLFTERMYAVLSTLIDTAIHRLQSALSVEEQKGTRLQQRSSR